MDSQERFEASAAEMDELREKMEELSKAVKESFAQGAANFMSDMEFTRASIDEISDETERKIELKSEQRADKMVDAGEKLDAKKAERIEKRRVKVRDLQNKINDLGQAYAKADQEELIAGLLEYAEDCKSAALNMAEESMHAYRAAAEELSKYNEKYGE